MKRKMFLTFAVIIFVTMGMAFAENIESELCGNMWELHYSGLGADSPYTWYRTFYFGRDGRLYERNNQSCGTWKLTHGGVNIHMWDGGLGGSIRYIENSSVMMGSGEINKPPYRIKIIMVKKYHL